MWGEPQLRPAVGGCPRPALPVTLAPASHRPLTESSVKNLWPQLGIRWPRWSRSQLGGEDAMLPPGETPGGLLGWGEGSFTPFRPLHLHRTR